MNEWQAYEHKGGQKKKLQLVDMFLTLSGLLDLIQHVCEFPKHLTLIILKVCKVKLRSFLKITQQPRYRIPQKTILVFYRRKQSLHWNQKQCRVYPVAVLRKVDGEIPEDHLIIISDDTTHDDPFVELANKDI